MAKKTKTSLLSNDDMLRQQAFENALQPNIISIASSGKIIMANRAACKLLGYSKKELLAKNSAVVFDINESSFKKMLKERTAGGHSIALVTAIKKNGKPVSCEITSAIFLDENGIEKSITGITDISLRILNQKNIDTKKEKIVADNIVIAKSKQKSIDVKKEKMVADNIVLAKSKQKKIDVKKEKIVADNIVLAKSEQSIIDTKKEKIVADDIVLAKSEQKKIDIKKEKIVADDIILAQAENDKWKKYVSKISYDVMWDWDIATGQIYVGDNIDEVFGYKVENNRVNFDDFIRCLHPQEKEAVEKKLFKALASGNKRWKDSYKLKRYDDSMAMTASRATIVRDEEGKAIHLIGTTQDISKLHVLETKLENQISIHEEDSEVFLEAAKLSFDVIWDWNLLTNEMIRGAGYEELFGYAILNNKGSIADWGRRLHPDDKESVEKGLQDSILSSDTRWEQFYRFIRADGTIAIVFDRGSIFRNAEGKAYRMIGAMHDLTRQKELEEKLGHEIADRTELEKNFKLLFNSSSAVLYDFDLVTNEVIISDSYEKEFGYKINGKTTPAEAWNNHIHPDDKEAIMEYHFRMLASKETAWKYNYRFLRFDNSVANVLNSVVVLRNASGEAYRILGTMQDIGKQKVLEDRVAQEIQLKEKQIAEAAEEAREVERSDIGKELHDNVNQLLGASKLYLEMAKYGGKNSEMYLGRSSEYTLAAIEAIRKLSKGLTTDIIKTLGLCEAIENIAHDTMEVNPVKISCEFGHFKEDSVNDKFKLNIFRIVQEQLNNILKHAKALKVTISLTQNKKVIKLAISDNGVGFDPSKKQKGIGIANIKSRAAAYNGAADFISQPGQGCVLNVAFPFNDGRLNKIKML